MERTQRGAVTTRPVRPCDGCHAMVESVSTLQEMQCNGNRNAESLRRKGTGQGAARLRFDDGAAERRVLIGRDGVDGIGAKSPQPHERAACSPADIPADLGVPVGLGMRETRQVRGGACLHKTRRCAIRCGNWTRVTRCETGVVRHVSTLGARPRWLAIHTLWALRWHNRSYLRSRGVISGTKYGHIILPPFAAAERLETASSNSAHKRPTLSRTWHTQEHRPLETGEGVLR